MFLDDEGTCNKIVVKFYGIFKEMFFPQTTDFVKILIQQKNY